MTKSYISWDIGGAHIKSAYLRDGIFQSMIQVCCPLWKGIDQIEPTIQQVMTELNPHSQEVTHLVTMTGELTDVFVDRRAGVVQIVDKMSQCLGTNILLYGGDIGFMNMSDTTTHYQSIASANWYASVAFIAQHMDHGIFVDMGSTTTDIIPFQQGCVIANGSNDWQRLAHNELVYTGITRTPIMAIANSFYFNGKQHPLMAELFATIADVYRVLGILPIHADLYPTCDGRAKSKSASASRIARMFGYDYVDDFEVWVEAANAIADQQQMQIAQAIEEVINANGYDRSVPIVSAGTGHFIVNDIASKIGRECHSFDKFIPIVNEKYKNQAVEYATVIALASLAQ